MPEADERPVCDDCRQPYDGPVYYTVEDPADPESGGDWHDDGSTCTGSFCPDCAGPFLDPDIEGDPRRPTA